MGNPTKIFVDLAQHTEMSMDMEESCFMRA